MKKIILVLFVLVQTFFGFGQTQLPDPVGDWMYDWSYFIKTPTNMDIYSGKLKSGWELSDPEKEALEDYWLYRYGNKITLLSEATRSYNCHGYAWYMTEVTEEGEDIWINTPQDNNFWLSNRNASYIEVPWQENAKVAFTENADHSAIATDHPDTIISKWGQSGLYKHHIDDCIYTPKTGLKYYKIISPEISGDFSMLCVNSQQTFSESRLCESCIYLDYDWDVLSHLTQVGNDYTSSYTVEATSHTGYGTFSLTITTPSGQTASTQKSILLNTPDPDDFTVYVEEWLGDPVPGSPDGPFEVCDNESYWICLYPFFLFDDQCIADVEFDFDFDYTVLGEGEDYIEITIDNFYEESTGEIYVTTTCGGYPTLKFLDFVEGNCNGYYMMFSPNPTTGETTLSIESTSERTVFDENVEWDIEVYNQTQSLKVKKTKIKGREYKLKTHGWKEGVYLVKAKYNNNVLTGKLVIKK